METRILRAIDAGCAEVFPGSLLAKDEETSWSWRGEFISTYLERDIPQLGPRFPAERLRRLWTMLAHGQGDPLNAAKLAAGLGVSGRTVRTYLGLPPRLSASTATPRLAWVAGESPR